MTGRVHQPAAPRVGEEHPRSVGAKARRAARRPARCSTERRMSCRYSSCASAMRSHCAGRPGTRVAGCCTCRRPAPARAEVEAGHRARAVDRQPALERQRIAAHPSAEHPAQVQRRVRRQAVVASNVEEAARVLRRPGTIGAHAGDVGATSSIVAAAALEVGQHVPARPRVEHVVARVDAQRALRERWKRPASISGFVAPRDVAVEQRPADLRVGASATARRHTTASGRRSPSRAAPRYSWPPCRP